MASLHTAAFTISRRRADVRSSSPATSMSARCGDAQGSKRTVRTTSRADSTAGDRQERTIGHGRYPPGVVMWRQPFWPVGSSVHRHAPGWCAGQDRVVFGGSMSCNAGNRIQLHGTEIDTACRCSCDRVRCRRKHPAQGLQCARADRFARVGDAHAASRGQASRQGPRL